MIFYELQSDVGLDDLHFAAATMRHDDQRFFDYVAGAWDVIAGSTVNERLENLGSEHLLALAEGPGDGWYRNVATGLGSPGGCTFFYRDLVSGLTAAEEFASILLDVVVSGELDQFSTQYGPLTRPPALLAVHLANTQSFRTWCGLAADDPRAPDKLLRGVDFLQRIFWPCLERDTAIAELPALPVAVISWGRREETGRALVLAEDQSHSYAGTLKLLCMDWAEAGRQAYDVSGQRFGKRLEAVWEELWHIDRANEHLAMTSIAISQPPFLPPKSEEAQQGKAFWCGELTLTFGQEA